MEVRYCSVMRVENGKVVEGRDYQDSASIARQLGLVAREPPLPHATAASRNSIEEINVA